MAGQTRDEIKQGYIKTMGEPLGSQFSELWQEVAMLFINWEEYVELFGTKPERIKLLNKVSPAFFHMLPEELWETRLLHLARLTDPPISMGNKQKVNLTINNLLDLIDHADTKKKVEGLTAIAMKATDFARDWRNRHIAHRDLELTLNEAATPLATGSREKVDAAINAIADVMNAVESHYSQSQTRYDLTPSYNGAVALLYVLDDGLNAKEARDKRIENGEYLEADLAARDI